jgi:hypothetical protein
VAGSPAGRRYEATDVPFFPEEPSDLPDEGPLLAGALLAPDEPSDEDALSFDDADASFDELDASFDALVVSDEVDAAVSLVESLAAGRLSFL